MKLGIQGVFKSRHVSLSFSLSFGISPPAPDVYGVILAFLLAGASLGEVGAMGGLFCGRGGGGTLRLGVDPEAPSAPDFFSSVASFFFFSNFS